MSQSPAPPRMNHAPAPQRMMHRMKHVMTAPARTSKPMPKHRPTQGWLRYTGCGGHFFRRFCKRFPESSPGYWDVQSGESCCGKGFVKFFVKSVYCWAVLQLPCCPSKKGELLENILQNLQNKWPPHPVKGFTIGLITLPQNLKSAQKLEGLQNF